MSNFRQADDATVRIRSFGVTFRHGQKISPQYLVPPAAGMWHQLVCATRGALTVRTDACAWVVPVSYTHLIASASLAAFTNWPEG